MTANEALTKLKVMLGLGTDLVETVPTVIKASATKVTNTIEMKFEEATLITDGTVVKVEGDFEVGKPLFVVTETETIPAPEGTHALSGDLEGVSVVVDANGIIILSLA